MVAVASTHIQAEMAIMLSVLTVKQKCLLTRRNDGGTGLERQQSRRLWRQGKL